MKTRDRIVLESLQLFNQHGERPITTNHIAAHLGISPGNLYYHFRNKEEIVFEIFCLYRQDLRDRLVLPETRLLTPDDLLRYLAGAFDAMWRYRFLFYDLPGMLARNAPLAVAYHDYIRGELAPFLVRSFAEFGAIGFVAVEPDDLRPLATNAWLLIKFWFPFEQTVHPQWPISEATSRRGIFQALALLKPYVQPPFRADFDGLMARYRPAEEGLA